MGGRLPTVSIEDQGRSCDLRAAKYLSSRAAVGLRMSGQAVRGLVWQVPAAV